MITQLGYLGINAGDLDRWEVFARDILGLQAAREDGILYLRMGERAAVIARPMPLAPPLTSATFTPESRRRAG